MTWEPTDEDVERAAEAIDVTQGEHDGWQMWDEEARAALATIGPIIERERRAAQAEVLDKAAGRIDFALEDYEGEDGAVGIAHALAIVRALADEPEAGQ